MKKRGRGLALLQIDREIEVFLISDEVCEFLDVFEDDIDGQWEFEIALIDGFDLGFIEEHIISLSIEGITGSDFDGHVGTAACVDREFLSVSGDDAGTMEATVMQLMFFDMIELSIVPVFRRGNEALKKVNSLESLVF